MEPHQLVSPCSSTPVGLVKDFVAKNHVTMQHYTHFPGMAPADFYLFPQLKSASKESRFCDDNDIIRNATEELKKFA
jgi:hypothetical protein